MSLKKIMCFVLVIATAISMLSGCESKVEDKYLYEDIEYTGEVTTDNFALLYNTLGYELKSTKKAFVRSVDYVDPTKVGDDSQWTVLDDEDEIVAQGLFEYKGINYGIQLWEADFSSVTNFGRYKIVAEITDGSSNVVFQDATTELPFTNRIYSNNVLTALTVYNAQARIATAELGGGYYDCNTKMGEAYSHGIFLNGLVQTYVYQRSTMGAEEKYQLLDSAQICFDYIQTLHDDATGEFIHSNPVRYNADINQGYHNTIYALYGYTAYLYYFDGDDLDRCTQENFDRAVKSVEYLNTYCGAETFPRYPFREYMIPIYYYLYKISGDAKWKDMGFEAIDYLLDNINVRTMYRSGARTIPIFEGLYLFAKEFAETDKTKEWITKLTSIKDTYYTSLIDKTAWSTMPISSDVIAPQEWDDGSRMPIGEFDTNWLLNEGRGTFAMDACFIAELTGDDSLEEVATGEISYIFGLNPGFEGDLVINPKSEAKISVGSFVDNYTAQQVRGWHWWEFTMANSDWMSIMNGYRVLNGKYTFLDNTTDDWYYGETFICQDGVFAYAMCIYENYINTVKE